MNKIYLSHNNIISSLGFNSLDVVKHVQNETSGLRLVNDSSKLPSPFYSSLVNREALQETYSGLGFTNKVTYLEKLLITSLSDVIKSSQLELNERVGLIISTTKGNIDALEKNSSFPKERAYLSALGQTIVDVLGFKNEAIVVSNACVSGVLAIATAKKFINQGLYDHVFVAGGDIVTQFILSGFNSFQAMSDAPCKPYDKNRTGINIGEVGASVLVTNKLSNMIGETVEILGDGSCNDANHISGPSRTGEGLFRSVRSAFNESELAVSDIDFISAHGTATIFNDEMEAIAFNRLGLQDKPLHSLKGFFGHTLGASGLLETIVGMHSLKNNTLYKSMGYEVSGVSKPLNVIMKTTSKPLSVFLKTASGFGGCNSALILKQVN